MSVAGTYDTVVKSPMGEQKGTFTVVPGDDGNTFTGSMAGGMGSMDVKDGKIDGDTLTWAMDMTVPMPKNQELCIYQQLIHQRKHLLGEYHLQQKLHLF